MIVCGLVIARSSKGLIFDAIILDYDAFFLFLGSLSAGNSLSFGGVGFIIPSNLFLG